ncbi:MAG: exonuclease SbcCD subunit D [Oscillospiraceae bacterium]|nr:exonuclease SbcCD subunit D [Oscillospiraceae bacterium]
MKFIHLSDLHIGKRLNNYSLTEEQRYILEEILGIAEREKPDGIIIAGDIYDRTVPSEEAVTVFDDFLVSASELCRAVFIISGNHDSPERLAFGGRLTEKSGVYVSPVFNGKISCVTLADEYGEADIYMLPFIKPAHARQFFPEADIKDYTDAVRTVISNTAVHKERRSIMIAHQFVTGAAEGGSEESIVGGLENVDGSVFEAFDYTALGHIHRGQNIGGKIRYCGSPLKYSFSEAKHKKSVTVVELKEKGQVCVSEIPLVPMREVSEIKGTFKEVMDMKSDISPETYLHITLTDEDDVPNAFHSLLNVYPNLMKLDYDNMRTRSSGEISSVTENEINDPMLLFERFFEERSGHGMNSEQQSYITACIEELWGGAE